MKSLEVSRVNVSNHSPCSLRTGNWRFMPVYSTVLPRAGRWLKQKRVSGSWWRSTLFILNIAQGNSISKRNYFPFAHAAHMLVYTDPDAVNHLGRFYRTFQFP